MRQSCLKFFSLLVLASTPAVALEKWDVGKLVASHVCLGCDLRGAHFFGTNLIGANLSGSDLRGIFLAGRSSDLRGADCDSDFAFLCPKMELIAELEQERARAQAESHNRRRLGPEILAATPFTHPSHTPPRLVVVTQKIVI